MICFSYVQSYDQQAYNLVFLIEITYFNFEVEHIFRDTNKLNL